MLPLGLMIQGCWMVRNVYLKGIGLEEVKILPQYFFFLFPTFISERINLNKFSIPYSNASHIILVI